MSKAEQSRRTSARTTDIDSSFHTAYTTPPRHATAISSSFALQCSLLFATSWDKSVRLYDCDNNVLRSKIDAGCVEHTTVLCLPRTARSLFFACVRLKCSLFAAFLLVCVSRTTRAPPLWLVHYISKDESHYHHSYHQGVFFLCVLRLCNQPRWRHPSELAELVHSCHTQWTDIPITTTHCITILMLLAVHPSCRAPCRHRWMDTVVRSTEVCTPLTSTLAFNRSSVHTRRQ
jgi:hypothetical protein